jgi:farnesyl-diphosphate farnesyltransferase
MKRSRASILLQTLALSQQIRLVFRHLAFRLTLRDPCNDLMLIETEPYLKNASRHAAAHSFSSDDAFQARLLDGVSRTFALTIPQLPLALRKVVANAYLLCRIVDTIEDEPSLSAEKKRHFCRLFTAAVTGAEAAERFGHELAALLSDATTPAEHELIQSSARVVRITQSFTANQRAALERCVRVMSEGMADFQETQSPDGLKDLAQLERYCYYVAGVVGEMLTSVFCDYSPLMAKKRELMMRLAVSFGQGLQMTNILKDLWEDRRRGACWLPQDVFAETGFDLKALAPGRVSKSFGEGLARLIGIAHSRLKEALEYTLLIPRNETGIRHFCLWGIGMALLTLRKINKHRDFTSGRQVKISRKSVRATIFASRLAVRRDSLLRTLFYVAGMALPAAAEPLPRRLSSGPQ